MATTPPFYFQDGLLHCETLDVGRIVNNLHKKIHQFSVLGKLWEVKLAIEQGAVLHVDSFFDAKQIVEVSSTEFPQKEVKVLLRVRPPPYQVDVPTHPYVNTSENSKFGFDTSDMKQILDILQENEKISVHGIHCHLGSCIYDTTVYSYIAKFVTELSHTLAKSEIHVKLLDLGGGIGIDYHTSLKGTEQFLADIPKSNNPNSITQEIPPSLVHFMEPMASLLPKDVKVLLEPGRSLVGNTAVLITKVLGTKRTSKRNYMIVDASMTDLIRPCLYGSHHRIYPVKVEKSLKWETYDVVGPVCETADFLGKDIALQEAEYLAIMDCGAYSSSMSSNYNMRPKASEIIVDGSTWREIRKRELFEDMTVLYH